MHIDDGGDVVNQGCWRDLRFGQIVVGELTNNRPVIVADENFAP